MVAFLLSTVITLVFMLPCSVPLVVLLLFPSFVLGLLSLLFVALASLLVLSVLMRLVLLL